MATLLRQPARLLLIAGALVASAAHIPVAGPHLEEAPYMGVLFVLLIAACALLAIAAVVTDRPVVPALSALICGAAIVGYAATRLVAFPMLADDVGNWLDPLGVVAVLSEAVVVACAVRLLATHRAAFNASTLNSPSIAIEGLSGRTGAVTASFAAERQHRVPPSVVVGSDCRARGSARSGPR